MNTPMKLAKTMNNCARVLRQRSSHLVSPRSGTWPTMGKPRSSMNFKPFSSSNLNSKSSSMLATKDSTLAVDQRRFYNDRSDWRENSQSRLQSGMDATYEMPNMENAQSRYDEIYLNKESAPTFEGNVEHEGFDPRYDDYHFKRQSNGPEQVTDNELRKRRSSSAKKAYEYVFGDKYGHSQNVQQEAESRRRLVSQDPVEHQLRQGRIIEENRRKWQNRAEPNREVHANGRTYKIDKVYGAEKTKSRPSRFAQERQSAEDYSRKRRVARESELRRMAEQLRQSRKGYKMSGRDSEGTNMKRTRSQMKMAKDDKPSEAWLKKHQEEEDETYWHSWSSCPDERRVIEKAQQVAQERGIGLSAVRTRPYHPYDVTRRSLHHHQLAQDDYENPNESLFALKARVKVPIKPAVQLKSDYLLKLMQQEEDILNESDSDGKEVLEVNPPPRRRSKPVTTLSQQNLKAMPRGESPKEKEMEVPQRRPASRKSPIKTKVNLPVQGEPEMKPQARFIEPPRFQMSVKSKVVRKPPPVSSFSDTWISQMSTQVVKRPTKYKSYARPSISTTWNDYTSAHFAKAPAQ